MAAVAVALELPAAVGSGAAVGSVAITG